MCSLSPSSRLVEGLLMSFNSRAAQLQPEPTASDTRLTSDGDFFSINPKGPGAGVKGVAHPLKGSPVRSWSRVELPARCISHSTPKTVGQMTDSSLVRLKCSFSISNPERGE